MVGAVRKALDILELFSCAEPRLTLAQISQQLAIPKSAAHNLLRTLVERGYVERPDRDHYALGTAICPLTLAVRVNAEVRDRAAPLLRELADGCHASSFLVVRDHGRALYVYAVESPQRLRARTLVGERFFLHCTGVGKAILAFLPPEESRRIVVEEGLPSFTPTTITDQRALMIECAEVRNRGYAVDRSEHELCTYCVAAPIFDARGGVLGACSVSGSDPRSSAAGCPVGFGLSGGREISRRGYVGAPALQRPAKRAAPAPRRGTRSPKDPDRTIAEAAGNAAPSRPRACSGSGGDSSRKQGVQQDRTVQGHACERQAWTDTASGTGMTGELLRASAAAPPAQISPFVHRRLRPDL
jgi:IclR family acetate operon transcriptional repressor